MESNINKSNDVKSNMKQYFIIMFALLFMFNNVSAETHLIWYPFESASTSTIFDMSGNNINAFLINGAVPQTTNNLWGSRNLFCDGINDYAISTLFNLPSNYSVSLWVRPTSATTKDYWTTIDDGIDTAFELEFDGTTNILELGYYNDSKNYTHRIIDNTIFTAGTWAHIVITIDANGDRFSYYKNGAPIIVNGVFPDGYSYNSSLSKDVHLCINRDFNATKIFSGKIDEYRVFDFRLNPQQITDLYTNNLITFVELNETPVVETTIQTNLINSTSINEGQTINSHEVNLDVVLNEKAVCEIYFDGVLTDTASNLFQFRVIQNLLTGNHTYFLYCENIIDNVKYFDYRGSINFVVGNFTPTEMTFKITPVDFDLDTANFYVVTPCMVAGVSTIDGSFLPYRNIYNTNGIQFAKVNSNGYATLSVVDEQNEFCLFNGEVRYTQDNVKTADYDIVQAFQQIDLGVITTPNNLTSNYYEIKVEEFDIYQKSNPKAWGQTWRTMIIGVILFCIGLPLVIAGTRANNGKIVVAGVLLLLAGMGLSFGGLIGIIF